MAGPQETPRKLLDFSFIQGEQEGPRRTSRLLLVDVDPLNRGR